MADRRRHSIGTSVILLIAGCIFIALGIGVLIALVSSLITADKSTINIAIVVPIILFVILPIAFGVIPLVMAIKQIYYIVREKKANKSDIETTARIYDYKIVSYKGIQNKRFALKLVYNLNGEKKFTTDYLFDINEFKYLQSLGQIKIKVDGNFVTVTEPFPEDIYKVDSVYGIPLEFYEQGIVKKGLFTWRILCPIAIVWLIISIVLTTVLHNGIYLITGVIILFVTNFPIAIILAIYFIIWLKRKRK